MTDTQEAPGHTDLMVSPEAISEYPAPAPAPTAAEIAADMDSQLATVAMLMGEINKEYTSKPRLRQIAGGLALSYASMVGRLKEIAEAEAANG